MIRQQTNSQDSGDPKKFKLSLRFHYIKPKGEEEKRENKGCVPHNIAVTGEKKESSVQCPCWKKYITQNILFICDLCTSTSWELSNYSVDHANSLWHL